MAPLSSTLVRRLGRCLACLPLLHVGAAAVASGDSIVNFWLDAGANGPGAPVIYAQPGSSGQFAVWARPADGYRLSAFALDLQAATPGVAALTSVAVLNPLVQLAPQRFRHQVVFDSATGLFVTDDEIYGFLGLSFFDNAGGLPNGAGVGPACGLDPECFTLSGEPAWRLATVSYQAGLAFGATDLHLAIGEQGLWQSPADAAEPDPPDETSAVFGLPSDAINHWATFLGVDHRHNPQGAADAVIRIASADFDEDDDVDGVDFLIWQRGFRTGSTLGEGDADGDAQVTATDLAAWRFQWGAVAAATPAGAEVPEPTGACGLAALAAALRASRRRVRSDHRAEPMAGPSASNAASQAPLAASVA